MPWPARTLILASLLATSTYAQVYKSIDSDGSVTYSSTPPANAVESEPVALPQGPSEQERADAEARARRTMESADSLGAAREAREKTRAETAKPPSSSDAPFEIEQTVVPPRPARNYPARPARPVAPARPVQLPAR